MIRWMNLMGVVLAAILTTGCFEVTTILKVNRNGSGTISERMTMSQESYQRLMALKKGPEEGDDSNPDGAKEGDSPDFKDMDKLEARALELGEGVKLVNTRDVDEDGRIGYVATYSFENIEKVKLSPSGNNRVNMNDGVEAGTEEKKKRPYRFQFEKDPEGSYKLTILSPEKEKVEEEPSSEAEEEGPETAPESTGESSGDEIIESEEVIKEDEISSDHQMQAMQMMKMFFTGLRIRLAVQVDGKIQSSNANHVSGNEITLLDFNMDELMADEAAFQRFAKMTPGTSAQNIDMLNGLPGVKMDLTEKIEVVVTDE